MKLLRYVGEEYTTPILSYLASVIHVIALSRFRITPIKSIPMFLWHERKYLISKMNIRDPRQETLLRVTNLPSKTLNNLVESRCRVNAVKTRPTGSGSFLHEILVETLRHHRAVFVLDRPHRCHNTSIPDCQHPSCQVDCLI